MCTVMPKTSAGYVCLSQSVLLQYLAKMYSVVTLDRELQPPAAYLPAEADSLFYQGIQYENEPRSDGLGETQLCKFKLCLYMYVVVNCTERECESCSYQCA